MSKLDGIKPNDRVRVTFEGRVITKNANGIEVCMDAHTPNIHYFSNAVSEPSNFHIEKLAPPLKVGDRVRVFGDSYQYEIVFIYNDMAWIKGSLSDHMVIGLGKLEPAQ